MARETLLDFFADAMAPAAPFLVYDDGYRRRELEYAAIRAASLAFAARLDGAGFTKADKALIWSENRPEWIVAFWGCLLRGVIVVPVDYRASEEFMARVARKVGAKLVLVGDEVAAPALDPSIAVWRLTELLAASSLAAAPQGPAHASQVGADDIAEIIFTSGATADPKGVVITHRNILANLTPVEREVRKYLPYARPFQPIRFLNLLPLSHMFGQAMATLIPPILHGTVVFMRGYSPAEIARQIRARRISVLVCVPKILEVLRQYVLHTVPDAAEEMAGRPHFLRRWWRYRRVHRLLGWKFWSFVVGAAPLPPDLEEFWSRLGFLVIQGYGLTETAPIVTLNHPFKARKGSVGTPIHGVDVRIGADGEILVRGQNVTTGYYEAEAETAAAFTDGWFHTGDVGSLDEAGRLHVRGRKKDLIVTADGLNVVPDDVEQILDRDARVRESAVVGATDGGQERVHAVVCLEPGADVEDVVRVANAQLEDRQRIRTVSIWPGRALPRTEGTRKLKRREIKRWVDGGQPRSAPSAPAGRSVAAVLARFTGSRTIDRSSTLEGLGLSSLERVELLMALEEAFEVTIDEMTFSSAKTVHDLERLVDRVALAVAPTAPSAEPLALPTWNRSRGVALVRRVSQAVWLLPLARLFVWVRVRGREHLADLTGPVVFAANHESHMDTPAILLALPRGWRSRVAPAMAKEFFAAHFHPEAHPWRARLTSGLNYYLAATFFNAFPLPQREAGTRDTLRYIGDLVSAGACPLIFPEGRRADTGQLSRFQAGVGMIGSRLAVPVVPVHVSGTARVLRPGWRMARPGRVHVSFGPPLELSGSDYAALARRVEQAVRTLGADVPPR